MVRDISDRRKMELKLRLQNAIMNGINRILQEAMVSETLEELGKACLAAAEKPPAASSDLSVKSVRTGCCTTCHERSLLERCELFDRSGHHRLPGDFKIHGIYGRVLADGRGLFTNDPQSHPDRIGLPEGHPPLNPSSARRWYATAKPLA